MPSSAGEEAWEERWVFGVPDRRENQSEEFRREGADSGHRDLLKMGTHC